MTTRIEELKLERAELKTRALTAEAKGDAEAAVRWWELLAEKTAELDRLTAAG